MRSPATSLLWSRAGMVLMGLFIVWCLQLAFSVIALKEADERVLVVFRQLADFQTDLRALEIISPIERSRRQDAADLVATSLAELEKLGSAPIPLDATIGTVRERLSKAQRLAARLQSETMTRDEGHAVGNAYLSELHHASAAVERILAAYNAELASTRHDMSQHWTKFGVMGIIACCLALILCVVFELRRRDLDKLYRRETALLNLREELQKREKLESLGQLAGGIAHDFNNLLTGLIGNISLARASLASSSDTESIPALLNAAESACLRAKRLTDQLLTFAKGGAPRKEHIDTERMIREVVGFCLRGSNTVADIRLPPVLWPLHADEGQASQLLQNLVINARQAMPEGGTIRVTAKNLRVAASKDDASLPLEAGRYVVLCVVDEGPGISADDMSKIFDPYFTTRPKGTGLGLSTAFSIARRHGGHIRVASTPGRGASFFVYLPAGHPFRTAKKEQAEPLPQSRIPGLRVLVMDDEELVRSVATKMLERLGCIVTESCDGSEAVRIYEEALCDGTPFDMVLMDLTVAGGMGGKRATKMILASDPNARIVVTSGYSADPIMGEFERYGFSASVAKPFRLEDLGRCLREIREAPSANAQNQAG